MNDVPNATDLGLAGKVAIVTGAGSRGAGVGNGRAAAVLLAAAGARVTLVDSVEEHLAQTRRLIEDEGGECLALTADVADRDDCARVVAETVDRWGRLDVLVNNVGIAGPDGSVVDVDLDEWDGCMRINVTSMVLMSRFAIPHMRAAGGGSIVNMSSGAGLMGGHPSIAYATSKGAILNLTRAMAGHHGPEGIRVNAIAPGMVYTPIVAEQGLSEADRERRRLFAPLQSEGTGWDVGQAVLFFASDLSRWVSGVTLPVDAGLTAVINISSSMTVTSPSGASR